MRTKTLAARQSVAQRLLPGAREVLVKRTAVPETREAVPDCHLGNHPALEECAAETDALVAERASADQGGDTENCNQLGHPGRRLTSTAPATEITMQA
jgi:hypothetical protein